ncbi:MAG: response regulator [Firmicutes bacterium]|nr:response regulator [Bacillota bacterium]
MIRVLIVEDEPPIQRRTKRMIEHIDEDFHVAAIAGDGVEALEKMRAEHFDVLFTDIRMPVMDGMKLMNEVSRLYPDCSIVALSGYQDFAYVSAAIRAQAVDYLLKPMAEETLEKLLFKLKEQFLALKKEHIQQSVAARLHHMLPDTLPDELQAVRLGVCLFCAGALPQSADVDLYDEIPDIWQRVSLTGMAKALCRDGLAFLQEFTGDSPVERVLVYQQAYAADARWVERLYRELLEQRKLPLSCIALQDTVPVAEIGKAYKRLRRLLWDRIGIGKDLFETVAYQTLERSKPDGGDFADDSGVASQYADSLSGGNPKQAEAFRRDILSRFVRENWTQRRILAFYQRVVTLLDARSQGSGSVLKDRDWFYAAVGMAVSYKGLEAVVRSLEETAQEAGEKNDAMTKVLEYLNVSFADHITGQTLARKFGYVPSYISFLFRRAYGQSPADYLTGLRLRKAKDLMRSQPALLIREVAEQVGFKNPYHFSRVFKKNEGQWPTEFKG